MEGKYKAFPFVGLRYGFSQFYMERNFFRAIHLHLYGSVTAAFIGFEDSGM